MACNRYLFLLFLFLMLLSADIKAQFINEDHSTTKKAQTLRPLIFIHGFKGSHLVDDDGHVKWISALTVLGINRPNLALPLTWSQSAQTRDGLTAKDPISEVRIFPIVPGMMIYGKWLKAVNRNLKNHLLTFAYDWRRDNGETSIQFEKFIVKALQNTDKQKCIVVAHSMGGLITLSVMNRRPELFDRVVFAGVPFRGCISFLQDMTHGKPVGLNRSVLSPAVLFTFPSIYTLFPGNMGSCITGTMVDQSGEILPIDFFSAMAWQANQLGIFAKSNSLPCSESEVIDFLGNTLAIANKFRLSLIPKKKDYAPVLVITSDATPTIAKVQQKIRGSSTIWDFEALSTEPGDGRITEAASLPPEPIQYELHHSNYEHTTLLNDPLVIERIFSFINT